MRPFGLPGIARCVISSSRMDEPPSRVPPNRPSSAQSRGKIVEIALRAFVVGSAFLVTPFTILAWAARNAHPSMVGAPTLGILIAWSAVSCAIAFVLLRRSASRVLLQTGSKKLEAGDLPEATRCFDLAIRAAPSARALHWRAHAYMQGKHYRKALGDLDRAIGLDSSNAALFSQRAQAKYNLKDFRGVVADLDASESLGQRTSALFGLRGVCRSQIGDAERAVADLSKALEMGSRDAPLYYYRGLARFTLGEQSAARSDPTAAKRYFQDALVDLDRAISSEGATSVCFWQRGRVKQALKDYGGAIADMDEAIRRSPRAANYFEWRAACRREAGDAEGAVADLSAAIELIPDTARVYCQRAAARRELGDIEGALEDCNEAIRLDPQYSNAYQWRAHFHRILGDTASAESDEERAGEFREEPGPIG